MSFLHNFLSKFHHEESTLTQEFKDLIQHVEDEITASEARTEAALAELRLAVHGVPENPTPASVSDSATSGSSAQVVSAAPVAAIPEAPSDTAA